MIKVQRWRADPATGDQEEYLIILTGSDSISQFKQLVNRALNCWDSAPKDLKDLGDMFTHGHITQNHTRK